MQFNIVFITTALLSSAPLVMSDNITLFAGLDCIGTQLGTFEVVPPLLCLTWKNDSVKSIRYSGVAHLIEFYISGGGHDSCTNGASLVHGGSGCANVLAG